MNKLALVPAISLVLVISSVFAGCGGSEAVVKQTPAGALTAVQAGERTIDEELLEEAWQAIMTAAESQVMAGQADPGQLGTRLLKIAEARQELRRLEEYSREVLTRAEPHELAPTFEAIEEGRQFVLARIRVVR